MNKLFNLNSSRQFLRTGGLVTLLNKYWFIVSTYIFYNFTVEQHFKNIITIMYFRIYINWLKLLTIIILSTEMKTFFLQNIIIYQQIKQFIYLYVGNSTGNDLFSFISSIIYILLLSLFKITIIQKLFKV